MNKFFLNSNLKIPGGLIGVGLLVDPSLTRHDKLVGNVLGYSGNYYYLNIYITY